MFNSPFEAVIEEAEVNSLAVVGLTGLRWSVRALRNRNIVLIYLYPGSEDMHIGVLRLFPSPISTRLD
jgi:hypothetical protein